MSKKKMVSWVSAAAVVFVMATGATALAHGGHGGDKRMMLLARAAGVSREQMHAAFKGEPKLKTDHENLRSTREAMTTCIVSGGSCSTQISAYSTALQTATQDKMNVWQKLFQAAPNKKQASSVLGQLKQLETQKHQIMSQVFGKAGEGSAQKSE